MGRVKLIQPIGEPDLEIVNVGRKLRGLPPAQMEWVCQYSCAAEIIPDCQNVNCEETLIVGQRDVEDLRGLVARGELAAFDGVQVQLQLDLPHGVGAALQRFVDLRTRPAERGNTIALLARKEETVFVRPAQFIHRLLLAQPYPPV